MGNKQPPEPASPGDRGNQGFRSASSPFGTGHEPADDIELPEPTLGAARISADAAEQASLEQVEAEAAEVEMEAEEAGNLALNEPAGHARAEPSLTLPGESRVEPIGGAGTFASAPPSAAPGTPGMPAAAPPEPPASERRTDLVIGVVAVAVLIGLALLLWLILGLANLASRPAGPAATSSAPAATSTAPASTSPGPATPPVAGTTGVIARDVSALDFLKGQCMRDYDGQDPRATVVLCSTPHSAQLLNTFSYASGDDYPGPDALKAKGDDVCRAVKLSTAAAGYSWRTKTAYPSDQSWHQKGDRRVDCFVIAGPGNPLREDLSR